MYRDLCTYKRDLCSYKRDLCSYNRDLCTYTKGPTRARKEAYVAIQRALHVHAKKPICIDRTMSIHDKCVNAEPLTLQTEACTEKYVPVHTSLHMHRKQTQRMHRKHPYMCNNDPNMCVDRSIYMYKAEHNGHCVKALLSQDFYTHIYMYIHICMCIHFYIYISTALYMATCVNVEPLHNGHYVQPYTYIYIYKLYIGIWLNIMAIV